MTLCALLIATVAAWIIRQKWRKSSWLLAMVTLAAFLAIGCGPLPSVLLRHLESGFPSQSPERWDARAIIVLLGGGTDVVDSALHVEVAAIAYGRVAKAAELYRSCKQHGGACTLLISGGDAQGNGKAEASVYAEQLILLGVSSNDLVLESHSLNTWQNAQFCAQILKESVDSQILLVSSGLHLRRSLLYFSHFGINATPVRADYERAIESPIPLSFNFTLSDLALHEYVGLLRYGVYQKLGLNGGGQRAGSP
jgi:uncharacterized SAM-binding protein YcdF (DUF218 family)